jgi:Serine protease gd N-terminus
MLNGQIKLANSAQTVYNEISSGQPVIFDVNFNSQNPVPKVVSISKNRIEVCRGQMGKIFMKLFMKIAKLFKF